MTGSVTKKKKNGGFSIVELIVVIAIMGVLTGLVSVSAAALSGRQAKQCRDELISSLDSVRTATLGKRTVTAKIDQTASGYTLTVYTDGAKTKEMAVCGKKVSLFYSMTADGSSRKEVTSLTLEFDRASGALKYSGESAVCHIYAVENGKEYGIRIYPETGKMTEE